VKMKKDNVIKVLLAGTAFTSVGISGYYTFAKSSPEAELNLKTTNPVSSTNAVANSQAVTTTVAANQVASVAGGQYKDGTYTGKAVSNSHGEIQLSITVTGGKISNVEMITYPTAGRSQAINTRAIPQYVESVIAEQSADISLVSGATETHEAFTGSLQDAINQAK
ncbi:MAG: FMN-binding protein, partial [Gemella sp.]|nr:FMN-binding protein [Gemella sp.]